ncbi:uncharacterized protein LOC130714097 isoform X2 [Lotus japonicus]|uniref:uncharacterized protein LOC130714097 isoform X2 n=1 Tax=Lotus japonicus TaxID=34305 RepID=UPI0025862C09|nr:uncharacterized protein LOC130714097 isoform X2 [Lotus japonicus]
MPATPPSHKASSSTIFAFTPRQVLLRNQTMKHDADNGTTLTLTLEQRLLLHQSIARYFDRRGLSKSLKKFRSEAKIEKDNVDESSVDLEELFLKYLETCQDVKSNVNDQKEQVAGVPSKNKEEGKSKEKKKKKSKLVSESLADNVGDDQLESQTLVTENKVKDDVPTDAKVINGAELKKKSKHKIKKKDKRSSEGDAVEQNGDPDETASKKEDSKASNKEVTPEEKKDSKKRKRQISEENGQQVAEIKADEETKRRKIENLNEGKLQKTSNEQANKEANGYLENATEKSGQRSQKKQPKGSSEPKPAFQRVQVDKIEFHDERLQDNSYWAKDGAENGYGAKAQEILGQVRGRDFRHEKTKKKRGTYRGGPIDLQSHSIKFNYSDDE